MFITEVTRTGQIYSNPQIWSSGDSSTVLYTNEILGKNYLVSTFVVTFVCAPLFRVQLFKEIFLVSRVVTLRLKRFTSGI